MKDTKNTTEKINENKNWFSEKTNVNKHLARLKEKRSQIKWGMKEK